MSYRYKPVCVKHGLAMFRDRNGIAVLEYQDPKKTEPYRIWSADLFACPHPECGFQVLDGFSDVATYPSDADWEERLAQVEIQFY